MAKYRELEETMGEMKEREWWSEHLSISTAWAGVSRTGIRVGSDDVTRRLMYLAIAPYYTAGRRRGRRCE